jgi:pimeloyl-ACP methyl ester carboxylesterase
VQADYVQAGGTRIYVRRWGNDARPSVLYWHGGGGVSKELPEIASTLEAAGYSVHAPDAPGFGESPALEDPCYRASNVAHLATGLIDTLGIAPTVWIGYSWGASIGVQCGGEGAGPFQGARAARRRVFRPRG